MITPLAMSLLGLCLALALWLGIQAGRRMPVNAPQIVTAGVLALGVLVSSVIAWVRLSGVTLAEPVTFVAYSIGALAPLPVGIQLARLERTRWGSVSLCFLSIVTAVMLLRLHQLWFFRG